MTKTAKVVATSKALIAKAGAEVAAMEPVKVGAPKSSPQPEMGSDKGSTRPFLPADEETLDERIDRGDSTPPPAVEHRVQPPKYPFLVGDNAKRVANQISHITAMAHRSKPDSFEACIRTLKLCQVKNLHPNVGVYRAECIDWLEGQKQK